MSKLLKSIIFTATLGMALYVNAESTQNQLATKEEARALFNWAMTYLKVNGRSIAYQAFNESNGKFTDRDLYVFCLDYDRTWKVMGATPSLVGKSASGIRDPNGKDFVGEFINIAKTSGVGTASYIYKNPVTGTEQLKTSFIQKVANSEFCGMGYYE
jgi:hypothetical protein